MFCQSAAKAVLFNTSVGHDAVWEWTQGSFFLAVGEHTCISFYASVGPCATYTHPFKKKKNEEEHDTHGQAYSRFRPLRKPGIKKLY
eukprot:5521931-Prymnesium_polylepis.1